MAPPYVYVPHVYVPCCIHGCEEEGVELCDHESHEFHRYGICTEHYCEVMHLGPWLCDEHRELQRVDASGLN